MPRPKTSVLVYAVSYVASAMVNQCWSTVSTTMMKIVGESGSPWVTPRWSLKEAPK